MIEILSMLGLSVEAAIKFAGLLLSAGVFVGAFIIEDRSRKEKHEN